MEEIESIEYLKKKLVIAEKAEELEAKFKEARCPICGSRISYKIYPPEGWEGIARAEAKCDNCDMFKKYIEWDSQKSYNWRHDGSSSLEILKQLYNSIKSYIK